MITDISLPIFSHIRFCSYNANLVAEIKRSNCKLCPSLTRLKSKRVMKYKTNKRGVESNFLSEFQSLNLKRWRGGRVTD